ncbi:DNA-directed DNA polymerase delta [Phytophthora pseudosyringae]|uniref:DNA-directed DNA polymerase delta n=1 Tax=Phytophthora pseudosyringae TaxID=221518 RepID=A0A8T1VN39_9STRA|nr:DNA-directed DNA polymerase delta [Phytophthora pseudosyringae]
MASPTLRRDQQTHHAALRFPPPPPPPLMAFAAAHSQQWRRPPMAGERLRADPISRFRSATELSPRGCPVLPTIASLLQAGGTGESRALGRQGERWEARKRKLPEHGRGLHADRGGVFPTYRDLEPPAPAAREAAASTAAGSPRVVMFMRRREGGEGSDEIRVRRPSPPAAAPDWDWDQLTPDPAGIPAVSSAMRRAVYREFGPRGVSAPVAHAEELADLRSRVRPTPAEIASRYAQVQQPPGPRDAAPTRDPAERRRLYFRHDLDPHKTRGVPEAPRHHDAPWGKRDRTSRYHRQVSPAHTRAAYCDRHEEEMEMRAQKRRRMAPSPTPPPRQPLYEPEYGLMVLETSKPLMRARYPANVETPAGGGGGVSASRRRYVRDDANNLEMVGNSPITVGSRVSCNGAERRLRTSAVAKGTSTPPGPRTQATVEKREPSPLTTLELKAKEFLKSKSLVRNRHDEIDWVATFLNVGFDSSSIYALMCPLRKGRWKAEEEKYTLGLLRLIESGAILLRHGQSIRGYIGENLHSDDMRVLKKLSNCKMFHFAKLINPRLAEEEGIDMSVAGAREGMEQLDQLKGEFLRSVQLEALVAVRRYLSDSTLRDLLNVRA